MMAFFLYVLLPAAIWTAFCCMQFRAKDPEAPLTPEQTYRKARWLELHHGGPKAYRPVKRLVPREVSQKPYHRIHKDPYTGEVSVEFR